LAVPPESSAQVCRPLTLIAVAFEIASVTEGGEPHAYQVPETIWR